MKGVGQFGSSVLARALKNQPLSPGKAALAWQVAAGSRMARAAQAELRLPATIRLRARDARWRDEIVRSRGELRARLAALLDLPELDLDII
jgi:hypothetical protein